MNSHSLLIYLLKSIFISGVFMGYYGIALRNKSFNSYNRFYLLLSMACSLIIPLFNFSWFTIEKQDIPVSSANLSFISTQITNQHSTPFSWLDVIFYGVISISFLLIALFALNVFKVYQLKRKSTILKMNGIDFIYTDLDHAPFSFLNNLFWKESISLDEAYGKKIFKHELTHIHQKHTLDIIFCQIINAVFWMNPFNWLIQKELKAIHEFIADKEAVGNNNVEDFVKLLLQVHYGKHFLNPTHAFYYSSIKRRLFMLTTSSKTTWGPVRKLLVLPVTLLVVAAMSVSTIESKANAIVAPIDAPIIESQPHIPSPVQQPNIATHSPAKQAKKPVVKNDTTPAPIKVTGYVLKNVKGNISMKGEATTLRADKIIISSTANRDSTQKALPNVLYYINDQPATVDDVSKLGPDKIKSINVLKGESAIKKYGNAGINGAIEIFTKLTL